MGGESNISDVLTCPKNLDPFDPLTRSLVIYAIGHSYIHYVSVIHNY